MQGKDQNRRIARAARSSQSTRMTLGDVVHRGGAGPKATAAYIAGIAYLWTEAALRYLTTNTSLGSSFFLYSQRTGDVVAIWFTSVVVSLLAFFVVWGVFKGRPRVGSIYFWTAILVVSTIIAPLVGEIGTPLGV